MKVRSPFLFALCRVSGFLTVSSLAAAASVTPSPVALGDSYQQVISVLGEPRGEVRRGGDIFLDYPRGQVELREGKVTSATLISQSEAAQKEQERKDQAKEQRDERASKIAEGKALKAETLLSPAFAAQSTSQQLAFWQNFRSRYPDVSTDDVYLSTLNRYAQEEDVKSAERAKALQIASLERRVAETEQRAARAEAQARITATEVLNAENSLGDPAGDTGAQSAAQVGYAPILYPYVFTVANDRPGERREDKRDRRSHESGNPSRNSDHPVGASSKQPRLFGFGPPPHFTEMGVKNLSTKS